MPRGASSVEYFEEVLQFNARVFREVSAVQRILQFVGPEPRSQGVRPHVPANLGICRSHQFPELFL